MDQIKFEKGLLDNQIIKETEFFMNEDLDSLEHETQINLKVSIDEIIQIKKERGEIPFEDEESRMLVQSHGETDHTYATKISESRKLFKCAECGKGFVSTCYLKRHLALKARKKPYSCTYCDCGYFVKRQLIYHISSAHNLAHEHVCSYCEKTFVLAFELKLHIESHRVELKFECPFCADKYAIYENFKTHLNKHTSDKLFPCKHCEKIFSLPFRLHRHMQAHKKSNTT